MAILEALTGPLLALICVAILLGIPLLLYVIARWRAPAPDPQLGLKLALGYFASSALQLLLAGGALLIYAVIGTSEAKGTLYREAFGLLVPGGLVLAAHVVLLGRTNQASFPGVRRLLAGYNLIVVGIIGMFALVIAFQELFAKGSAGNDGRIAAALVLVYGGAWAVMSWQAVARADERVPPPPEAVAPRQEPPPPAQPGLPSLGGGSFPPINR